VKGKGRSCGAVFEEIIAIERPSSEPEPVRSRNLADREGLASPSRALCTVLENASGHRELASNFTPAMNEDEARS